MLCAVSYVVPSAVAAGGNLLRYWRHQRGKSQLNLSLDTGISQRHLSFVESGRSVPSRDVLLIVSETLDIPLRERNVLLLASGYAPVYTEGAWEAPEMAAVTKAIDRVLKQQEPHPALALDRYWNVIRTNEAAPRFFGSFIDLEARKRPRNLLDLMFDPAGMRPFVEKWRQSRRDFCSVFTANPSAIVSIRRRRSCSKASKTIRA
jgi:transcriptional regulator with XRE-family HTH domain